MFEHRARPDRLRRALVLGSPLLLAGCEVAVGATLPEVQLPPVAGLKTSGGWDVPGIDTRSFAGKVTVMNVWASWCPYCRGEHDLLKAISASGRLQLVGLIHNDTAEKARAYLAQAGNPYAALSVDSASKITNALGQRGVPHTYVIGRDLKVTLKIAGALSDAVISGKLMPAVEKAWSV